MKKIIFLSLILFSMGSVHAQDDQDEIQTIFNDNLSYGGYGGPIMKVTPFNHELGMMMGGGGGFMINRQLVIGGAGYGLLTPSRFQGDDFVSANDTTLSLNAGYGGFYLEYVLFSNRPVHLTIPLLLGGGEASVHSLDPGSQPVFIGDTDRRLVERTEFMVIEPGLNLELNVLKFFRLDLGMSYRYITGSELINMSDNDLSDLSFNLGFRFGYF